MKNAENQDHRRIGQLKQNKFSMNDCFWPRKYLLQPRRGGSLPAALSEGLESETSATLKPKCHLLCYTPSPMKDHIPPPDRDLLMVTEAQMFLRGAILKRVFVALLVLK